MAQVINTNIASLNAQRNLNKSQGMLNTSLQRLSSGMRINSAKDDAAGLAISERFTAQIKGLNQAARNSNDGISLAQTAEGALAEVTNNLQRIRELAVQSANATNSSSDRAAMQQEVTQLVAEIDRVASTSNFNGVKLLDGSFTSQTFQVGANVGETISIASIVNSTKEGLGLMSSTASVTGSAITGALAAGELTINNVDVGVVARDASALAAAINATGTNVTATAAANVVNTGTFTTSTGDQSGDIFTLTVQGVDIAVTSGGVGGVTGTAMDVAFASGTIIDDLAAAGITTSGTFAGGNKTFTATDGSNIVIASTFTDAAGTNNAGGVASGTGTNYSTLASVVSSVGDLVIGGSAPGDAGLTLGITTATVSTTATKSVSTVADANILIATIDTALNTINGSRATLGAVQNRFESVVTSLQTSAENLSASRSRIQDTDFASETANLTKAQILQQAGMAMMAQANSLPQNVLSLLQ
ncbi:MAG: flagellin [SAR86 cluster bacterium]|uniref:Flagellin n=1 Tax=SAR86 cluster bacterium TaxID=2030880 RepID=A0A2A5CBF6_9GAMM|nr:MAG: flagellin [SAR86 cluster bacterium]